MGLVVLHESCVHVTAEARRDSPRGGAVQRGLGPSYSPLSNPFSEPTEDLMRLLWAPGMGLSMGKAWTHDGAGRQGDNVAVLP